MVSTLHAIAAVSGREKARIRAFRGEAMSPVPDKVAAIAETSALLLSLGVDHALIGGVAVGLRAGVARATEDTDFAVDSAADRDALVEAFTRAGFTFKGRHAHSLNFRHSSGEPIQLAFDPWFDERIARAEVIEEVDVEVRVVSTDDLIAMKERAANDPGQRKSKALRDLADVALLRGDVGDPDEGW